MRFLSLLVLPLAACTSLPKPAVDSLALANGRVVAQLVHATYDVKDHAATCKPFHRVFATDGRQLTKDLGGLFDHHRGIFVGWNHVTCEGRSFDFWHCRKGETQRVVRLAATSDGKGHDAHIEWLADDGAAIVREQRTVTVHALDDETFRLDVLCSLQAAAAAVVLGGDPQHAGCQFRALQAFTEEGAPKVTYLRPPSAQGGKDDVWTHCAWIAAVLPMPQGAVTVLRVEAATNPSATWSTRPYGRFGAMSKATLTAAAPLQLRIAYVVSLGARDAAWCERLAAAALPR